MNILFLPSSVLCPLQVLDTSLAIHAHDLLLWPTRRCTWAERRSYVTDLLITENKIVMTSLKCRAKSFSFCLSISLYHNLLPEICAFSEQTHWWGANPSHCYVSVNSYWDCIDVLKSKKTPNQIQSSFVNIVTTLPLFTVFIVVWKTIACIINTSPISADQDFSSLTCSWELPVYCFDFSSFLPMNGNKIQVYQHIFLILFWMSEMDEWPGRRGESSGYFLLGLK